MIQVVIDSTKMLYNLEAEQKEFIKEQLMVPNPAYAQAKRYSKWGNVKVPQYLSYYIERKDHLVVPVGYTIPFDHEIVEDLREEVTVAYPRIKIQLRDTQKEAYNSYIQDTDKGIICLPTGKGKSILGIYLAYALRQRCLIIVHKDDLVTGWTKDIKMCLGDDTQVGLYKAKKKEVGKYLTISTIQTLSRLSDEEFRELTNKFGMVIVDECLVADTLIEMQDGGFKFIDKVNHNDLVCGGTVSNPFHKVSEVYQVKTAYGTLQGSPTHPTFVYRSGKRIEVPLHSVLNTDYLPIKCHVPHTVHNSTNLIDAKFIAMMQSNGHLDIIGNRLKINVSNDQSWYTKAFISYCHQNNIDFKSSYDIRGNLTLWSNDPTTKLFLESNGCPRGNKSSTIEVPQDICYAPIPTVKSYVGTVFSCEGSLDLTCQQARIILTMKSKKFILGISHLLKKFNICAKYGEYDNNRYRLSVSGDFFNLFMNEFRDYLIPRKYTPYRNVTTKRPMYKDGCILVKVIDCKYLGYKDYVYDYTTSSHTFIANGFVTHNCHHIASSTFGLVNEFNAPYKIGLTATPERKDKLEKILEFYLGDFAYKYVLKKGEVDKDILPVKVITSDSGLEYLPKVTNKGTDKKPKYVLDPKGDIPITDIKDYKKRPQIPYAEVVNLVVTNPLFMGMYLNDIQSEYNKGRSCVVFLSQKEHCRIVRDKLITQGVPDEDILLYYGDSKMKKDDMMNLAENKRQLITLATYSIATEGTNVKQWEVAFLVSSVNDGKNVEQAIGRIRRTTKGEKLKEVIAYDYRHRNVYMMDKHEFTRNKRYKKLMFKVESRDKSSSMFSKGYIRK